MENAKTQSKPAQGIGIRWFYLALGTLLLLLLGLIYAWSVFIRPLEAEFGWNRAQTSMTFTLSIIFFCVGGIVGGVMTRRFSPFVVMAASAALLLLGFGGASRVGSLWGIYIAYGVCVGLGVGLSYNALVNAVTRWFPDKKGLASGILLMGFGVGGMLLGTLAAQLMSDVGWRLMFIVFAVVFAVVILAGALVLRAPTAQQQALLPAARGAAAAVAKDKKPAQMLRTASFWVYFIWSLLLVSAGLVIIGHAATVAGELGAGTTTAATIAGLVSVANGGGRILFGYLYDRAGLKPTMIAITLCALAAPLLLLGAYASGQVALLGLGFVLTGAFYGGVPTMNSTFAANYYGPGHFAVNFSIVNASLLFAPLLGSYLAGALQTASGSYNSSFLVMLAFAAVAVPLMLLLKKHPQA